MYGAQIGHLDICLNVGFNTFFLLLPHHFILSAPNHMLSNKYEATWFAPFQVFLSAILTLLYFNTFFTAPVSFKWCVTSSERAKCQDFIKYVNEIALNKSLDVSASCVEGSSYDDCAAKIKDNKADLVTLDGGHVYAAGNNVHIHGKSLSVTYFWIWAFLRRCRNFKPSLCRLTQFHLSYDALLTLFLTISIQCQEIRLWELIKWSPKRKHFDRSSKSLTHSLGKSMETSLENLYVDIGT